MPAARPAAPDLLGEPAAARGEACGGSSPVRQKKARAPSE